MVSISQGVSGRRAITMRQQRPRVMITTFRLLFGFFLLLLLVAFVFIRTSTPKIPHPSLKGAGNTINIQRKETSDVTTIAYAVSITGCGSDPITEGAAVLKHSIHRSSSRGTLGGTYDYKMFAIYHPSAEKCARPLEQLGYTLLKRDVFIKVADIQGQFLREKIEKNGCCGEKELIKLEAYRLTDYPIAVHLDLDVLVLKPLDDLFDIMMATETIDQSKYKDSLQWPQQALPERINSFFTYDYNMVGAQQLYKPVQGGFLVMRPDQAVYEEFREIVRKGDFREGKGWGGLVGPFHGSMTFQGIVPYFYNVLHPGQSVELNRCVYNQMCDNPRTQKTINDVVHGDCRTGEKDCEDCRSRPIEDVVTTHYTLCQKPWLCLSHDEDIIQARLCRKLTKEWYKVRSELEQSWGRSGKGLDTYEKEIFFGYCQKSGDKGYALIEQPYGPMR
jgi:hypothetical protein